GLPTIVVTNGDAPVAEAVVSMVLPPSLVGESFVVRGDEDDEAVVTQILRDRTLAFVVRDLAPREVRRLRLEPALDRRIVGPMMARERLDGVDLSIDGRPVATYRTQPALSLADGPSTVGGRGGYLHPLRTPAGRIVTDDDVPERPDQRGLWSAWGATRVNGRTPDFWHTALGTGAVEFEGVLGAWSGPVVAGFRARHRAVDRTVRPPLTAEIETWDVTLPALGQVGPRHRVLDLTIRHEVVIAQPIVVAAAAYGGLGLRGPRAWHGSTGMAVLTSEGRTRRTASRSRARWVAMVGLVGGSNAGVAILDHPDNLRHPQPLFVDAWQPFLSLAPMQTGALTLSPGQEVPLRYRIVTFDGFPDRAWLERLWQAYAHPPRAAIVLTP
ncbi:MAG: PmoA family protein, partial [Vicinamibacteraceae bacterium]